MPAAVPGGGCSAGGKRWPRAAGPIYPAAVRGRGQPPAARGPAPRRPPAFLLSAAAALATLLAPVQAPAAPAPADLWAADSLARREGGRDRDRALARWAASAALPELMFLLRHPSSTLGRAEGELLEAALRRAAYRPALHRRLLVRLAAGDSRAAARARRRLAREAAPLPRWPYASAFRMAVVLPDSGDYEAAARALHVGLQAGLAQHNAGHPLPLALLAVPSGDERPESVAAAFERASEEAAIVVGGLQGPPTAALALAARLTGVPLFSPAVPDESLGAMGPMVFQVGPADVQRGRVLARVALAQGPKRIGLLTARPVAGHSFARGFAAAAESLGARVVWSASYAPGSPDFRAEARALRARGVELLFWDGEALEAAALLRQLAAEPVPVAVCGGAGLDPERHHAQSRPLLEGAQFVGEDWELAPGSQAVLDSAARAAGEIHPGGLHARGYLAARLIASAVAGGALCVEELAAALATRLDPDPGLRARGVIAWHPGEAILPVFTITGGRAAPAPEPAAGPLRP